MSDETRVARVYAEALFQAASEEGAVASVEQDLEVFVGALKTIPELWAFFLDEDVPEDRKKDILLGLTESGGPLFRNFLRILVDKDREPVLEEVYRIFGELVEQTRGIVRVELTSALPLSEDMHAELQKTLEDSLGKTVDLTLSVDDEILGGARLRIGDRIADASIRHRLEQLRARLVSPTAL